jgi:predicted N-acetyltransferase YhbS
VKSGASLGFSPAVDYDIKSEYDVPFEVFMVKEL